jgi:hypothetical protein
MEALGWEWPGGEGEACTPRICMYLNFVPTTGSMDSLPLPIVSPRVDTPGSVSGDFLVLGK